MAVEVIDKIKPKNGGSFPVVEGVDVEVSEGLRLPEALAEKADVSALEETDATVATKANAADVAAATANLQAQINQIITPVTQDAEVQNARIGADGTSYTTLKARLDTEQNTLKTDILSVRKDLSEYVTVLGVVGKTLNLTAGQGHSSTLDKVYFPVESNESIYVSATCENSEITSTVDVFVFEEGATSGTRIGGFAVNRGRTLLTSSQQGVYIGFYLGALSTNETIQFTLEKEDAVTYTEKQLYISPIITGVDALPFGEIAINRTDRTITIPKGSLAFAYQKNGKLKKYSISPDTPTEISLTGTGLATAVLLYYNITTSSFEVVNWSSTSVLSENRLLIGTFRTTTNNVFPTLNAPYNYTDNEEIVPASSSYCRMLIGAQGIGDYPQIDTGNKKITIYGDTLLIDNRLPGGIISISQIDVSWSNITTSALELVYDLQTNELAWKPYYSKLSPDRFLVLCSFRTTNKTIVSSCPMYVDGKLFGVIGEDYENTFVKSVNHRGYNVIAPENTLSAFKLSKKKGFEYVECDVQLTSDGIPVIIHDETIDRTSNGTGNVADMTFEQLRELDFGSWKSVAYTGEKIPSFEEFITLCRNLGLKPYIELKSTVPFTATNVSNLIYIVKKNNMLKNCTWISQLPAHLSLVNNALPNARLGLVATPITSDIIATTANMITETNEVFISTSSASDEMIEECIARDIPVEFWTINSAEVAINLHPYVSGVTSDNIVFGKILVERNI